jgi:hypothetical protein
MMVSWLPWDKLSSPLEGGENIASFLGAAFIIPAMVFALLWQYARRRVWLARLALGCAVLAVPLTILIAPAMRSIAYPHRIGDTELQLAIATNAEDGQREYARYAQYGPEVNLSIPVTASAVEPDRIINVDGYRVMLTGDNGWRWRSEWLNRYLKLSRDDPSGNILFSMPSKLADQLGRVHAQATVDLAFGVYRLGAAHRVETSAERFTLPGAGYCHWFDRRWGNFTTSGRTCVAPLHLPEVVMVEMDSGDNSCNAVENEPPLPAGHYASDIEYGAGWIPDFDPNPVREIYLGLNDWVPTIPNPRSPKDNIKVWFCRGTPLTVRTGVFSGRMGATFSLGALGSEKRVKEDSEGTIRFDP